MLKEAHTHNNKMQWAKTGANNAVYRTQMTLNSGASACACVLRVNKLVFRCINRNLKQVDRAKFIFVQMVRPRVKRQPKLPNTVAYPVNYSVLCVCACIINFNDKFDRSNNVKQTGFA